MKQPHFPGKTYDLTQENMNHLIKQLEECRGLLLDVFSQSCSFGEDGYDHMCLSAYEHAQFYLIKNNLIKEKDCQRK